MNVAVLSCGPSLAKYWNPGTAEALRIKSIVAVNTAAWKFHCDWLVASDRHIFESAALLRPRLGCVTNTAMPIPIGLARRQLPLQVDGVNHSNWMQAAMKREGMDTCAWTFPNAIAFAREIALGGELHIYGFDAIPGVDVAGIGKDNHNNKRWRREFPWIREVWRSDIVLHSDLDPDILSWIKSERGSMEELYEIFPCS